MAKFKPMFTAKVVNGETAIYSKQIKVPAKLAQAILKIKKVIS